MLTWIKRLHARLPQWLLQAGADLARSRIHRNLLPLTPGRTSPPLTPEEKFRLTRLREVAQRMRDSQNR